LSRQPTAVDPEFKIRELEKEIDKLKCSGKAAWEELQHSFDRMRKTMGGIIQAMSQTIEQRDPYTAGHQRQEAKLSRVIAIEMGFGWERIQGIRMAAAIHDLGKIHVPRVAGNRRRADRNLAKKRHPL